MLFFKLNFCSFIIIIIIIIIIGHDFGGDVYDSFRLG